MSVTDPVDPAKVAFIEAALANGVLLFGTFTLKSGRSVSPHLKYLLPLFPSPFPFPPLPSPLPPLLPSNKAQKLN